MKRAAIVLTCLMISSVASAGAPKKAAPDKKKVVQVPKRKVAVAAFDAPKESRARNSVLAILSEHDEIEVISLEDIAFEAHRVHVDPKNQAGREKIAEALGVELWIDGVVDGSEAHLKLTTTRGRRLVAADVRATTPSVLDGLIGERMWAAMGRKLSAKENRRRTLLDQTELARTKITDRERELLRQTEVAVQRAAQREKRLKAEHELALSKRAAQQAEIVRQGKLVSDRKLSEQREQQRIADQQRRAELAQQQAEQRRQQAMLARQYPRSGNRGNTGWGGGMSNPYQGSASRGGYASARAPSYQPKPAPAAASAGAAGNNSGLTTSTQRWLQEQQGPSGSGTQPPPSNANAAAPTVQSASNAEQASPQIPEYAPPQISPATQRWLAQQQQQR